MRTEWNNAGKTLQTVGTKSLLALLSSQALLSLHDAFSHTHLTPTPSISSKRKRFTPGFHEFGSFDWRYNWWARLKGHTIFPFLHLLPFSALFSLRFIWGPKIFFFYCAVYFSLSSEILSLSLWAIYLLFRIVPQVVGVLFFVCLFCLCVFGNF